MRIAIIGGGITGLTTALALKKFNIEASVFESFSDLRIEGAGVWMQPNALKVFDFLAIKEDIISNGTSLTKVELLNGKTLIPFQNTNSNLVENGNLPIVAMHRGRLLETLYSKLNPEKVHFNKRLESLSEHNNNISLKFEDGSEEKFDLVLGADGIHSAVRKSVFDDTSLRYSGQTCWRGIADFNMPNNFLATGNETWLNNKRFGFSNINPKQVYWFAVEKAEENQTDETHLVKENVSKKFSEFHPLINQIINATERKSIFRNDISDLKRLKTWSKGNVCLLGDAGHATTPNMGQGACQGIEDAYFIAHYIKESESAAEAFTKFEQKRRKKVDSIVNQSWQFGQMAHSTLGRNISIALMKILPASIMQKQLEKVYELEAI
ncbi:MAG: FAD-dependent monooxygenase [Chitinophagales bacterium]